MKTKDLALAAHKHLRASTPSSFKRADVYELLAACFGFNSYAAFGFDSVFTQLRPHEPPVTHDVASVTRRYTELGHPSESAQQVAAALQTFMADQHIGSVNIAALLSRLSGGSSHQSPGIEDEHEEIFAAADGDEPGPLLLDGLEAAANKDSALAHYALALINAPDEDDEDDLDADSSRDSRTKRGQVPAGAANERAKQHAARLARTGKYMRHLREAGRLGNARALLDLAEQFDDPTFFDQPGRPVDVDPAAVAAIAERMGRVADARHWLTLAAESGDTDAMLQLIEEYDRRDLLRCWTWLYLSQLVGTDLAQSDHYAVHEDGSEYDEDVGGPSYVEGRDGVELAPLSAGQAAVAMRAAQGLFARIQG